MLRLPRDVRYDGVYATWLRLVCDVVFDIAKVRDVRYHVVFDIGTVRDVRYNVIFDMAKVTDVNIMAYLTWLSLTRDVLFDIA